jgi:uncharacterized phage protein gp47/JayE
MSLTLSRLLTPVTQTQAENTLLGILDVVGFPATSWQPKSLPRTFVKGMATLYVDLTELVANIAAGGLLKYATSAAEGWLDLCAESQYQEYRTPAVSTVGKATLTNQLASPYVIDVGQLWAQDDTGRRYNNTTGGTLAAGGTLQLEWKAESPGAAYNIAAGALTTLATPLPRVSVSNPALPSSSTWITTSGADVETNENLVDRCQKKWPTLGTGGASLAYVAWAKQALAAITRVRVDDANPDGPGTVRVYLATSGGVPSLGEVALVDTYIQARRALTATVTVSAAEVATIVVTATLYVYAGYATTAPTQAAAAVSALGQNAEIGATVYLSRICAALSSPAGVRNVVVASPVADQVLLPEEVPGFVLNLTTVLV